MNYRRLQTVLIVSRQTIARVDVLPTPSKQVVHVATQSRPLDDSIADALQTALVLGANKFASLWILTDALWTGVVELPNEIVQSVGQEHLHQSIALEAEFDSGIDPFGCQVAYHSIANSESDASSWQVLQATEEQLHQIHTALGTASSRLRGIGAIPADSTFPNTSEQIEPADDAIAQWAAATAQGWIESIDSSDSPAVIRIAAPRITPKQLQRLGVFGFLLSALLCGGFHLSFHQRRVELQVQSQALVQQYSEIETELKQITHQQKQAAQSLQEMERNQVQVRQVMVQLDRQSTARQNQRLWPHQFLQSLLQTAANEYWVQKFELQGDTVKVSGIATSSIEVAQLASRLTESSPDSNWRVQEQSTERLPAAPLVRFEILIEFIGSSIAPIQGELSSSSSWGGSYAS